MSKFPSIVAPLPIPPAAVQFIKDRKNIDQQFSRLLAYSASRKMFKKLMRRARKLSKEKSLSLDYAIMRVISELNREQLKN